MVLGTKKKGERYNKDVLYAGIDEVLRVYNKVGIYVKTIHADHKFKPLFNDLEDKWEVTLNFSNPGEHVPDMERENRTLEERF